MAPKLGTFGSYSLLTYRPTRNYNIKMDVKRNTAIGSICFIWFTTGTSDGML
jgi:hypothetical protein